MLFQSSTDQFLLSRQNFNQFSFCNSDNFDCFGRLYALARTFVVKCRWTVSLETALPIAVIFLAKERVDWRRFPKDLAITIFDTL